MHAGAAYGYGTWESKGVGGEEAAGGGGQHSRGGEFPPLETMV